MGVNLNPNNGPEKDEGLTCLSDSLSRLSLLKSKFDGIEKSFAQISLVSKEEEVEEEGMVKDAEEKEKEERGRDIDEKEHKTERRTDEEEKEEKHEFVEDKKLAKGDEEEKREEEEEKTVEIKKKLNEDTEVCLDLNKRKEDLKESEKILATDDVKTKEEKESSKVTITSIPKDEDKDVDKLDAKLKTEKTETEEEEKHSSGEESSEEEEKEEKQKIKASGKAPKYRARGLDDNKSDLYHIIEYHSPDSYFPQPTQSQFHHGIQYGQSPSYSVMSPSYLGMGGVNEQTNFMADVGEWLPLSPAQSIPDDNDSNLTYNDLSSGMANNSSQLNDQYNQPFLIGDQYQYGQCQQIQPGAPFIQQASSHRQAQPLVPDYYVQLPQEEVPSPLMFSNPCSPQQQPNFLCSDQASPQPTEVSTLQSTEYSKKLDLACTLLKNEVEHPSRTQFSEAEVAPIKEDLLASISKMEPVQPINYIHPATIQPIELPDYNWDMKCNDALFMQHYKKTATWTNNYVTCIDQDGDTPSMVVACKPAEAAGYAEKLRAVVERQKGVDMCCNQPVAAQDQGDSRVCQVCRNSNPLDFHSSLGIRNKQGDTILSSVVRMRQPAFVIHFVLTNLRPADLFRIFTNGDAQFYADYAQYYPELQKYQ